MITIFNGRRISLDGTQDEIYAQVSVAMRDKIHYFNTGKSCNPFAVFMCVALHTDRYGWAYPKRRRIEGDTGLSTKKSLSRSLNHLRAMRIDGYRVLETYRERDPETQRWGETLYRIFPDAWDDGLEHVPGRFRGRNLVLWDPMAEGEPGGDDPPVDDPPVDNHPIYEGEPDHEGEPNKKEHISPDGDVETASPVLAEAPQTPLPFQEPLETVEIVLEGNPNPAVPCPACEAELPLSKLKKSATRCPMPGCGAPLRVMTDMGQWGKPPKPKRARRKQTLDNLLGEECPTPLEQFPYKAADKEELLRAWHGDYRGFLLKGFELARRKYLDPKNSLPPHRVVPYALAVYRNQVAALQEVQVPDDEQPRQDSPFPEPTLRVYGDFLQPDDEAS